MNKHKLYKIYNNDGRLLYIGISDKLLSRISSHIKRKPWSDEISIIRIDNFKSREELEEAERSAIGAEKPLYNVINNNNYKERIIVRERKSEQREAFSSALSAYLLKEEKTWFHHLELLHCLLLPSKSLLPTGYS